MRAPLEVAIWSTGTLSEYLAAAYLLRGIHSDLIDTEKHLDDDHRAIAWEPFLLNVPLLSSGEALLVKVALSMWTGRDERGVGFGSVGRGLDDASFERVVEALRLRRGIA